MEKPATNIERYVMGELPLREARLRSQLTTMLFLAPKCRTCRMVIQRFLNSGSKHMNTRLLGIHLSKKHPVESK